VPIPFVELRNRFLELSQEQLLELTEQERDPMDLGVPTHVLEDEDDEAWEPDDEERESDDWDPRSDLGEGDDPLEVVEQGFVEGDGPGVQFALPAVLVDLERTPGGPRLAVTLADEAFLRGLVRAWRERDDARAAALDYRLTRLLEFSREVVQFQRDFLLGDGPRKPLTGEDIAREMWEGERLETKKATVSRLLSSKHLRTPAGECLPIGALLPSRPECLLEHICSILRDHDRVEVRGDRTVAGYMIPVDSQLSEADRNEGKTCIVAELKKRWGEPRRSHGRHGDIDGLSPESVKRIMKENNIPRVASRRRAIYEAGRAWWWEGK